MDATIPARFEAIIALLCSILLGRFGYARRPYAIQLTPAEHRLVLHRIRAIGGRFASIVARFAAGTLRPAAARPPSPSRDPAISRKPAARWPDALRQDHGWLQRRVHPATWASSALYALFRDPEMQALLRQLPQLRRVIRPLCTMLDVEQPPPQPVAEPERRRRRRSRWPFFPNPPAEPTAPPGPTADIAKNR